MIQLMLTYKKLLLLLVIVLIAGKNIAQNKTTALSFILMDEQKLQAYKSKYASGDKAAIKEVNSLLKEADEILSTSPYSVTYQKTKLPPSGDKHDYVSRAPYWWADSSKPNGLPYIRRDGRINPERTLSKDNGQLVKMSSDVKQLALAYYFSGKEVYAEKALKFLKVWFTDTATRMNPNLNYGQYIPGINDGRGIGIIETGGLTNIPDALALMQQSKQLDDAFVSGIRKWFTDYANWLMTSKNGKDERSQKNNHGTYYDMQLSNYALFIGNLPLAQKVIKEQSIPRMDVQFTAEGAQPLELTRTKSWQYTTMNLTGWCRLATIAERLNIDLWHTETKDGKGIQKLFDWFMPYMLKEKAWNYEQIEPIGYNNILTLFKLAASKYPDNNYKKMFSLYPEAKDVKPWLFFEALLVAIHGAMHSIFASLKAE